MCMCSLHSNLNLCMCIHICHIKPLTTIELVYRGVGVCIYNDWNFSR